MAQNAAAAVIYTLTSLMEGETSRIALVGRLAVDSVIDYLYQVNDPDANVHGPNTVLDDWIQRAPLLAKELELQHNMLEELRSRTNMDPAFLLSLKLAARTRGVQPFARGIVKET
jgi:hypothetical protein